MDGKCFICGDPCSRTIGLYSSDDSGIGCECDHNHISTNADYNICVDCYFKIDECKIKLKVKIEVIKADAQ